MNMNQIVRKKGVASQDFYLPPLTHHVGPLFGLGAIGSLGLSISDCPVNKLTFHANSVVVLFVVDVQYGILLILVKSAPLVNVLSCSGTARCTSL